MKIAFSKNLKKWEVEKDPVLKSRKGYFDASPIRVISPIVVKEGILLPYFIKTSNSFGVALFDKKDPEKLLWRSANPVWKTDEKITPLGIVEYKRELIFYLALKNGTFKSISLSVEKLLGQKQDPIILERSVKNPIIQSVVEHPWEAQAVLNPGAIYLNGRIHLVYRAIGLDGNSTIGYASSKDGINFDERLDEPIYIPTKPFESRDEDSPKVSLKLMSGGGYGGCEDPRLIRIGDRIYMMYVAFNGWEPTRIALTSIKVVDFTKKKWKWKNPVLISPEGEMHKNWVLFPEKIKEKYAILHSLCPKVSIEGLDSLDFDGKTFIKSYYNSDGKSRGDCWDGWVRGAGPPPIKTRDGWLLMYHAMDHNDPGKYKLGAMMLDIDDPSKVLYRAENPVLEPKEYYENQGKSGVVYACGAVVMNGQLFVYYGGADMVVCVATANLDKFLKKLRNSKQIKLKLIKKEKIINKHEIKKVQK